MKSDILSIAGIAVFWFITAIVIYKVLRIVMVGDIPSLMKCAKFVFVCGNVITPGLLSGGHPPPIPVPGAALLLGLAGLVRGGGGEEGSFFIWANLGSWIIVTTCIALVEVFRASIHSPTVLENDASSPSSDQKLDQRREKTSTWGENSSNRLVAEFVRSIANQSSYRRAVIDRDGDNLVLSLYEGEQPQLLALLLTYVAHNWEDLDIFLQSRTDFRKGDFHVAS